MSEWPYSEPRWQRLRELQLSAEPLCRFCSQAGRTTLATDVDHVVPVRQAPDRAFDQTNLQSLCRRCHSGAKQGEERTGEVRGCDVNGVPLKGWS